LRFLKIDVIDKKDFEQLKLFEISTVKGIYSLVGQQTNSVKYSNQSFIFDTTKGINKDKAVVFIENHKFTIGPVEEMESLEYESVISLKSTSVEPSFVSPDEFRRQSEKQEVYAIKVDVEKRIIRGVVYAPNVADAHDEFMTAGEIEKAAHRFMLESQKVDDYHNFVAGAGHPIENYIAQKNDPNDFPEGAWIMGIKVTDDDTWKKVKEGKIRAFSWAGMVELGDKKELPSNWYNEAGERIDPYASGK
jgi:hypothetical protein